MIPIFILNVYRDNPILVTQCLTRLRLFYPTAPIVMISDGDQNIVYSDLAFQFRTRLVMGSRVKLPPFGGAWSKRVYVEGLREEGDTIIRLDPDSYMWHAFMTEPTGEYCGHLVKRRSMYIHGACKATSVATVKLILDDFSLPKYVNNDQFTYIKNNERVTSCDLIMADVVQNRGIPLTDWSEISPYPFKSPTVFAVTHGYTELVQ